MRRRGFRSRGRASGGGGRLLERIRDRKILALRDLRPLDRPAGLPEGIELGAAATEGRDVVLLASRQSGEELIGWAQIGARLLTERDRAPGEVLVAAPLFGERTRRTAEWLASVSGLPWRLVSIPSLAEKPEELTSQDLLTGGGQGWNPLASGVLERVVRVMDGAAALTASGAVRPAAVGAVLYMRGIRILTAEPESDGIALRFLEPERRLLHVNEANFPRWAPELHEQIVQLAQDPRLLSTEDAGREAAIEQSAAGFGARITARWLVWRGDGAEPLDWCGIDASGRAVLGVVRRELTLAHVPALLGGLAVLDGDRALWAPGAAAGRPKLCVTAESVDGTARGVIEDLGIDFAFADEEVGERAPALELTRERERDRDRDRNRERDRDRDRDRGNRDRDRDRGRGAPRELQARDGQDDLQHDAQPDLPRDPASDPAREGQPERERSGRRRSRRRRRGRGGDDAQRLDERPRSELGESTEPRLDDDREDGLELTESGDDGEIAEPGFEAAEPDFDAVAERTLDEEDAAEDLHALPEHLQARALDDEPEADDERDDDADGSVRADAPERGDEEDAVGEPAQGEATTDDGEETSDEPPVVPARRRRQRAAIAVRNDVDSLLAGLVLARERRNVPFFWVCAQHELMDFFRGKATDLDDNTDLVLVGFTAQPLPREVIGCAELYRGRLEWFDYHDWPVEDVELLGQAIGQDSIQFSQGTSGALAPVMEIAERRSRFTDKLVDLAGRRLSETDMERWGYRLMGMLRRACQRTGDYRNEIQPVLTGKPTDLPEMEGVYAEELAWLDEHKPRVVNFGEYQMAVLHAPEHLDPGELGRRLRQRTGARLSFASREGDDLVQVGYNEERRHINVMALVDHLDARMPWLHARPGGDRVGRLEIEDLPHHPERIEEVIGEIVRSKSILYG